MPNQTNNAEISVKVSNNALKNIADKEINLLKEICQSLTEDSPTKEDPKRTILSEKGRGLYEAANMISQGIASYNKNSLEEIKKNADEVFNDIHKKRVEYVSYLQVGNVVDLAASVIALSLPTFGLGPIVIAIATTAGGLELNAKGQAAKKEFVESLYNATDNICAKAENNALVKVRKGMKEFCDTLTPDYKSVFKYFIMVIFMPKFEKGQLSPGDFMDHISSISRMTDSKNVYSVIDELNKYDEKMSDKDFNVFIDTTVKKILGYTDPVVRNAFHGSFILLSGLYADISGKKDEIEKLRKRIITSVIFDDPNNRWARILQEKDEAKLKTTEESLKRSEKGLMGGALDKFLRIASIAMAISSIVKMVETSDEADQADVEITNTKNTIVGFFEDMDKVSQALATSS